IRGLKNGQLDLGLRSFGTTTSNSGTSSGQFRLRLNHPGGLTVLFVQVTPQQVVAQGCPGNVSDTTRPRARLIASFFNDGWSSGPGDQTGDVQAFLDMVQDSSTGPAFLLRIVHCTDPQCGGTTTIGSVTFTKKWALNQPHTLLLFWDAANNQVTGFVDFNTAGQESHS